MGISETLAALRLVGRGSLPFGSVRGIRMRRWRRLRRLTKLNSFRRSALQDAFARARTFGIFRASLRVGQASGLPVRGVSRLRFFAPRSVPPLA